MHKVSYVGQKFLWAVIVEQVEIDPMSAHYLNGLSMPATAKEAINAVREDPCS